MWAMVTKWYMEAMGFQVCVTPGMRGDTRLCGHHIAWLDRAALHWACTRAHVAKVVDWVVVSQVQSMYAEFGHIGKPNGLFVQIKGCATIACAFAHADSITPSGNMRAVR